VRNIVARAHRTFPLVPTAPSPRAPRRPQI